MRARGLGARTASVSGFVPGLWDPAPLTHSFHIRPLHKALMSGGLSWLPQTCSLSPQPLQKTRFQDLTMEPKV